MKRKLIALLMVAAIAIGLTGCDLDTSKTNKAVNRDRKISQQALATLQESQPAPLFKRSQIRQNVIEIETAQANSTQTHTFFFNQGVVDPISDCPSIGFPIPSTAQLTNPEAKMANHDLTLPQAEVTGVFIGDSTGTYVICIDAKGKPYATYWEGFVQTVSGPAHWNRDAKQVELLGPSSFNFSR